MSRFYAKALLGSHDGLRGVRAVDVTFAVGNSPEQMFGAWLCHYRWGFEEHKREIDSAGFAQGWMEKAQSGTFLQIVGWDGAEPVAMVELRHLYDPMLHEATLYGDHAYVHPAYRNAGVMRALVDLCIQTAEVMSYDKWMVPVTAGDDATAPFLRKVYESCGFAVTGLTMTRRAA